MRHRGSMGLCRQSKHGWTQHPHLCETTSLTLAPQGEDDPLWGCSLNIEGPKGRGCLYATPHTLQKKKNPTIVKMFIYEYRGKLCTFINHQSSNYPLYTYSENIYNRIQEHRAGICQNHSFGDGGVFSVATHIAHLRGADTTCLDLVFEYPFTTAAAACHTAAGLDLT
jgi:hypothetical protein